MAQIKGVKYGKKPHMKEATHNGKKVRLFIENFFLNCLLKSFIGIPRIQILIFLLTFPHTEHGVPVKEAWNR